MTTEKFFENGYRSLQETSADKNGKHFEINKCFDGNGNLVYKDKSCEEPSSLNPEKMIR